MSNTTAVDEQKVRWGLIGTGAIAKCFAKNLLNSRTGVAVAVGSRTKESADKFANEFDIARRYGSYDELLADAGVDAVYISTPHPWHAEWSIKALRAGKHVLCEKPFALNAAQAMAVHEAALLANKLVMEAFMYRCHPQTHKLVELLQQKVIGEVRVINATFSFQSGFNAGSRLFNNDLAGGGIMDVGCYPASIVRLIAGVAQGQPFADPTQVQGVARVGTTGVDEWATATLKFPGDILANIATGVMLNQENVVRIFGSEGSIYIPNPWVADRANPTQGKIIVNKRGEPSPRELLIDAEATAFTIEADTFGEAVLAGKTDVQSPAMSKADTLGNIRLLDRWRQSAGVVYEQETPAKYPPVTVSGAPLAKKSEEIPSVSLKGLDKPVSRFVMGCDNQVTLSHCAVMFDDFYEKGGNTFDTAFIYGGGLQERLLGQWIKLRGVRSSTNVIVKGCHTPSCDPRSLTWQLKASLERLQIDCADIYMMHRDNIEIPVGEFVDVLNEHVKAGRIKVFGGSNWSIARVQEANDYAAKKGLQGFGVVSNNLSLARMVDPVWGGCVTAHDADSRAWLTKTQTALLSWSSQARGFFLPGRAAPDKLDDKELARCWYSDDNFQRLHRANELAKKLGVAPINIAAAWVLNQPFPAIALIGPRELSETRTSLPGATLKLDAETMKWLNLEDR
jgi:predicted dehydrogenase/aryl-alcohol dehydrogenase-like predicted oxidoreductase